MAFFSGTIYSESLNMDTSIGLILPHDSRKHRGIEDLASGILPTSKPKTLILLHGLSDNHMAWTLKTSIMRYAEDYDIAVLIPEVQRSFYMNMKNGPSYFSYISEELIYLSEHMFNISLENDDLMIAGLSMGGYGALACGLTYPERFYSIGAFSSVANLKESVLDNEDTSKTMLKGWEKDRAAIFGEQFEYPEEKDLFYLAEKAALSSSTPRIYMTCGRQDFLYKDNLALKNYLIEKKFDIRFEDWDGKHEWSFWDVSIHKMLDYFL